MNMKKQIVQTLAFGYDVGRGLHFLALHRALEAYTKYLSPLELQKTPLEKESEKLVLKKIFELFRRDAKNIATDVYPASVLRPENPRAYFSRLPKVFKDAIQIHWRRIQGRNKVFSQDAQASIEVAPEYLKRNYHFQTDGYFSEESASFYDTQVEMLFAGTAAPMRRVALEAIVKHKGKADLKILEVACGNGVFSRNLAQTFSQSQIFVSDVSPAYLEWARERLRSFENVNLVLADACKLPFEEASMDVVVSVYMFHELPIEARNEAIIEARRVLKPGGLLVILDSLQTDDIPEFNSLLKDFPVNYHEPFYPNYIANPLEGMLGSAGFEVLSTELAFLSKAVVARSQLIS
jgi:ubiquinone/menaquinone biosynthesis C-methylase UbiE